MGKFNEPKPDSESQNLHLLVDVKFQLLPSRKFLEGTFLTPVNWGDAPLDRLLTKQEN